LDNIKIDLREIGWGDMEWIDLAQDRDQWRDVVNTVMNLRVPLNVRKFLSIWATGGFSRRAKLHEVNSLLPTLSMILYYMKSNEFIGY
jgi:hypothetical protein